MLMLDLVKDLWAFISERKEVWLMPTGLVLVAESSLSFLGLSVKAPTITWGSIIAEGRITPAAGTGSAAWVEIDLGAPMAIGDVMRAFGAELIEYGADFNEALDRAAGYRLRNPDGSRTRT